MTGEPRRQLGGRRFGTRLALVLAGATMVAQGVAGADTSPGPPTKPVHATKADVAPGRMYSSPAFAVDPRNRMRVVAGFADLNSRRCGLMRSVDGAATWTLLESSPSPSSFPFCSQSQGGVIQAPVAFGRDGTLYMAMGGWDNQEAARTAGALLLARSDDLGDSWETVEIYSARGKTGEAAENIRPVHTLAVDTRTGSRDIVYVTFNVTRPGLTAPNAEPARAHVAVSRDGGRSFEPPIELSKGVLDAPALRDQALRAVTTTTVAPGATTTTTTTPPADSRAANPNQAANFAANGGRFTSRPGSTARARPTWPG